MHQTTMRFSPDLWDSVEAECSRLGVSAAQYIREATLARLAYTAGWRREPAFLDLVSAGVAIPPPEATVETAPGAVTDLVGSTAAWPVTPATPDPSETAAIAVVRSSEQVESSAALWGQAQVARKRAQELRAQLFRGDRQLREVGDAGAPGEGAGPSQPPE
jgi:hypothetical protein